MMRWIRSFFSRGHTDFGDVISTEFHRKGKDGIRAEIAFGQGAFVRFLIVAAGSDRVSAYRQKHQSEEFESDLEILNPDQISSFKIVD